MPTNTEPTDYTTGLLHLINVSNVYVMSTNHATTGELVTPERIKTLKE
jgi:hypothetical protein